LRDSLKKRYVIKLLASFITGIVNIILVAIVPKALGPVAFGHFSFIQQFFAQILSFLDAGTSTAFFTKLSANHTRKELIKFYTYFSVFILGILFVFIYSIDLFDLTNTLLPKIPIEYAYLGIYFGFLTWLTQIYIKVSDAYVLTVSVEIIKIVHKFLSLILLFAMIYLLNFDLTIYFYFHFISLITFLLIITILFFKKDIISKEIYLLKLKYHTLTKEFYEYASPLFVFNSVAIAIALFDIWLLQYVSGSIQTGFYGLAYSIAAMCFLFTGAMTQIITREFAKSFEKNNIDNIKKLFKRYIPMLYSISAYFGVFIALQGENLLHIFTDKSFADAYYVLAIMAFYPIHQTYGQLSGSLFFAMEKTPLYRNIGIFSSLLGLLFTFIFVYLLEYGAEGFAWKMVIIQIIGVNIQLYFNAKHLNINVIPFIKHQILSIAFFVFIAFITYIATQMIYVDSMGIYGFLMTGFIYTFFVLVGAMYAPYIFSINKNELNKYCKKARNAIGI
jgi:O-antigen/teichoic acid export membrane protein